jgi:hypothetical protein
MPKLAFDRFYRYADLTEILESFARERPISFRYARSEEVTKAATSGW